MGFKSHLSQVMGFKSIWAYMESMWAYMESIWAYGSLPTRSRTPLNMTDFEPGRFTLSHPPLCATPGG